MGSARVGFPQDCKCRIALALRAGTVHPCTHAISSIVRGHDLISVGCDASPTASPGQAVQGLQPAHAVRDSSIKITCAGCPSITDRSIYAARAQRPWPYVYQALSIGITEVNPSSSARHYLGCMVRNVTDRAAFNVSGAAGGTFAYGAGQHPPPFSPKRKLDAGNIGLHRGGLSRRKIFYAPARRWIFSLECRCASDCVLVTARCERDELGLGLSQSAHEMGHIPQSGANGLIAWSQISELDAQVLIHIKQYRS